MNKVLIDYTESRFREPEDKPLTCAQCGVELDERAYEEGLAEYGEDNYGGVYCEQCTEAGWHKPEYMYED